jgi:hypothetical protein
MTTIQTNKLIYSKTINQVTDTTFNAFVPPPANEVVSTIPTVSEFFDDYDILFYQIPQTGTNSHETLIEKSSEYLGLDLQQLLDQLNLLQEQNKQLQKQIDEFNTNL